MWLWLSPRRPPSLWGRTGHSPPKLEVVLAAAAAQRCQGGRCQASWGGSDLPGGPSGPDGASSPAGGSWQPTCPFSKCPPLEDPGGQHPIRLVPPGESAFISLCWHRSQKRSSIRSEEGPADSTRPGTPCSTGHLSEERPSRAPSSCPTPSFCPPATAH